MATMTTEQEALKVIIDEKLAANRALLNQYHASGDEQERAALTIEIDARSEEVQAIQRYFRSLRVPAHRRYRRSVRGYSQLGIS